MLNLFQYLIFPLSLSLSGVDVHIYFAFFSVLLLRQEAAGLRRKVMIINPVAASPRGTEKGECFILKVWPVTRKHSLCNSPSHLPFLFPLFSNFHFSFLFFLFSLPSLPPIFLLSYSLRSLLIITFSFQTPLSSLFIFQLMSRLSFRLFLRFLSQCYVFEWILLLFLYTSFMSFPL